MTFTFELTPYLKELIGFSKFRHTEQDDYPIIVNAFIRQHYSQSKVEAVMNNYLDDMTNEKHKAEFDELQDYRKACKQEAKRLLGIE